MSEYHRQYETKELRRGSFPPNHLPKKLEIALDRMGSEVDWDVEEEDIDHLPNFVSVTYEWWFLSSEAAVKYELLTAGE